MRRTSKAMRQLLQRLVFLFTSAVWISQAFFLTQPSYRIQSTSLASQLTIQWCPSCIEFDQVSLTYPDSLWRKLTSSVPRREWALSSITCSFCQCEMTVENALNGIVLLLGASSSGKSTLLKLIQGTETPTEGSVHIFTRGNDNIAAKPILLDDRSPLSHLQNTVQAELTGLIQRISEKSTSQSLQESFANQLCTVLDLPLNKVLADLSPSQYYKFRLAKATVESSMPSQQLMEPQQSSATTDNMICLPGPILLLDEWMDTETSEVVSKVVDTALQNIVSQLGGIVICVTHKPHLFGVEKSTLDDPNFSSKMTTVTMSAGKFLSVNLPGNN